ncbi:MAG: riboflavin synthase [Pseudomonadota bacterium]
MFTGLIEEIGDVKAVRKTAESFDLTVATHIVLGGVKLGDSIAINGVCLTVTAFDGSSFTVGLAPETLKRTNLGDLTQGDPVNLERSLLPTTRLGGHFVQGHVDATGVIKSFRPDNDALWLTVKTDPALMRYIVTKGYVAIDGTSLTVVDTGADWFNVTLINYTQSKIILPRKKPGDRVNLEVDILAKYIERLTADRPGAALTPEYLQTHGFMKEGAR